MFIALHARVVDLPDQLATSAGVSVRTEVEHGQENPRDGRLNEAFGHEAGNVFGARQVPDPGPLAAAQKVKQTLAGSVGVGDQSQAELGSLLQASLGFVEAAAVDQPADAVLHAHEGEDRLANLRSHPVEGVDGPLGFFAGAPDQTRADLVLERQQKGSRVIRPLGQLTKRIPDDAALVHGVWPESRPPLGPQGVA